MMAGVLLLGAMYLFSVVFTMDNFTLLYLVSFMAMGMPMGVIHTASNTNKNAVQFLLLLDTQPFFITCFYGVSELNKSNGAVRASRLCDDTFYLRQYDWTVLVSLHLYLP